ncbi:helix-turn-helix domain-containing protein [Brucella intermedia]|uniref:IclR family transcriptional regulator n=1 Tax=Brucella intermedia TaxID=94625 RepID=UPI001E370CC0|nr:IclR family transcriptional regulator C-terminal domain-containing protein [Brucella intermedia]MCB4919546.1 helix-turn-helix domain-containing protein [Brucella intermedia]
MTSSRSPVATGPGSTSRAPEELSHDGSHWIVTANPGGRRKLGLGLVPALDKAIAVIEYLNWQPSDQTTLANISSALEITKSHCHSILKTLQDHGWLRFDERAKTYTLHPGLLGSVSKLLAVPTIEIIRTEISALVSAFHLPCVVSQPMPDHTFMLVDKIHDPMRMEVSLPIGFRYPRDASAQMRAYLAWMPEEKIRDWFEDWVPVQYTTSSLMTEIDVFAELKATRLRGYARSCSEFTDGLMALALPIFGKNGDVEFIINCPAPMEVMSALEDDVATAMRRAVQHIHQQTLARLPCDFVK